MNLKVNDLFSRRWPAVLLILAAGIIVYANSFQVPFVLDDKSSIVDNPVIKNLENYYANAIGHGESPRRVIAYLTFALNYHFGGLDVTGYHVVNLLIHLINALLVYALLLLTLKTVQGPRSKVQGQIQSPEPQVHDSTPHSSLLTPHVFIPLFAALLFVTHPIQTQAVTYIVQRMTSLATLFYLLSLVLYVMARLRFEARVQSSMFKVQSSKFKDLGPGTRDQGPRRLAPILLLACATISAVLGMKTKEIVFTLPFMILMYEIFFFHGAWKRRLLYLLPILLTAPIIPISVLTSGESAGDLLSDMSEQSKIQTDMPRVDYLFTQFRVIVTYLRLLVVPVNQNLDYDYPIYTTFFNAPVFLSFFFLLALFAFAIYLYFASRLTPHASRLVSFGILWFFLALAVESSLIPIVDVIFEHRIYLPSIGAFAAFAVAFCMTAEKLIQQVGGKLPLVVAVLLVAGFSVTTLQRNHVWGDHVRIWQDTVSKSPKKVRTYNNLGVALTDAGRPQEAVEVLLQAIKVQPFHPHAYNNLGRAYILIDQSEAALPMLKMAIRLYPEYDSAYINLAAALNQLRQFRESAALVEQNLSLLGGRAEARYHLGVAYAFLGNKQAAWRELAFVSRMDPVLASDLAGLLR